MSMARCSNCDRIVDTDSDTEFYEDYEDGVCEYCREVLADGKAEDERLDDPRYGQADYINGR